MIVLLLYLHKIILNMQSILSNIIISVNDKPAVSALETMDQVAEIRPGSEIPVVIMRDDKKLTLHIAVQEYPATN